MQLVIHPDAQLEIIEAADWYEQRATGLGDDLVGEVQAALEKIVGRPSVWPTWPGAEGVVPPIQRYLLARFRYYGIAYQHLQDSVLVLALVHFRRRPFYWMKRVDEEAG